MRPDELPVPAQPQIVILDAGGQYCHLEARKVRDLGVYAEVRPSEIPAAEIAFAKGIIISGGPSSVYDPGSPTVDPAIFAHGQPVLGICYGQQLMAHLLGGQVTPGEKGEYGLAMLDLDDAADPLFAGLAGRQQIWMSHRDVVGAVPEGFSVVGRTETCAVAAIAAPERKLYGVQFHPEVVHTARGMELPGELRLPRLRLREGLGPAPSRPADRAGNPRVRGRPQRLLLCQRRGGFHASPLRCARRALGPDRVRGVYVDTGLMREGETEFVGRMPGVAVEHARSAVSGRSRGRHRPRAEAPHHRRRIRARAGARDRIAPPAG